MVFNYICSCSNEMYFIPCQKKSCDITDFSNGMQIKCSTKFKELNIQKQIQNQVRIHESQLIDAISSAYIGFDFFQNYNKNIAGSQNMSDRVIPHLQTGYIGRKGGYKGNSVKYSITSHKPGSTGPAGVGVDVKHGSYARYLGKLKAPYLIHTKETLNPKIGNKTSNLSLLNKRCNKPCC